MPRFVSFVKYSPAALKEIRTSGFKKRLEAASAAFESVGGHLEAMYFLPSTQWDFVLIADVPNTDAIFAILNLSMASGSFDRVEVHEARTADEADRVLGEQPVAYTPPTAT